MWTMIENAFIVAQFTRVSQLFGRLLDRRIFLSGIHHMSRWHSVRIKSSTETCYCLIKIEIDTSVLFLLVVESAMRYLVISLAFW